MHCHVSGHRSDQCERQPPEHCYTNTVAGAVAAILRRKTAAAAATEEPKVSRKSEYYPARELLENEKVLREFVRSHIGIPALKLEENKARIKEWTKTSGWKIRYIPDKEYEDEFAKYDVAFRKANPHIEDVSSASPNTETTPAQKQHTKKL